jgi:hypothetical protein
MAQDLHRTLEVRPECVIERWFYNGEVGAITLYVPGTVPPEDSEVECPDGYLGNIDQRGDLFEVDTSAGFASPVATYETFEEAVAFLVR